MEFLKPLEKDKISHHENLLVDKLLVLEYDKQAPFTLEQIRAAIPRHCFEKSVPMSLYFFFKDWFLISFTYFLAFEYHFLFARFPFLMFPAFWLVQGTLYWALFVVGHDCGHGSFSEYPKLNFLIGHLTHTPLLVPFHSWRISHHKHHLNTGNVAKDETWRAMLENQYTALTSNAKLMRFHIYPLGGFLTYLISGMPFNNHCHFWPYDPLFSEAERRCIMESLTWWIAFASLLTGLTINFGFGFLLKYYLLPLIIFGAWIAIVTHLHHTHPDVPWYSNEEWTFLKGNMSTVDRDYGIVEDVHHNIGSHMVHHLFFKIPHYHLKDATAAIKPILGCYYKQSEESILLAMFRLWKECRFVPNEGKVRFFKGVKAAGLF